MNSIQTRNHTMRAALALSLVGCTGSFISRKAELQPRNPQGFVVSSITEPILWGVRDEKGSSVSFEWISPADFTERTKIKDLQLDTFPSLNVHGFRIIGAFVKPDGSSIVCAHLQLDSPRASPLNLWEIKFSPQGEALSLQNLPRAEVISLFMQR